MSDESGNGGGSGGGSGGSGDDSGGGGGNNGSRGDGSGGGGNGGQEQEKNGGEGPTTAEKVVMAVSVTFTALLFAYVVWQAIVTPSAVAPEANVVGTATLADGSVRVNVELTNNQDIGLISATIEVNCTQPPPELDFQHVPADGRATGSVSCPSGTSNPEVSVSTWVEA